MTPRELFINHSKQCISKECSSFSKADTAFYLNAESGSASSVTVLQTQNNCSEKNQENSPPPVKYLWSSGV